MRIRDCREELSAFTRMGGTGNEAVQLSHLLRECDRWRFDQVEAGGVGGCSNLTIQ